jgi:hypothetical protein
MTAIDTAKAVLAKASLFDQTFARPDMGIAVAWAEAFGDMDQADAMQVVTEHYRSQTRRLMPADVLDGVRRIRNARLAEAPEAVPDADPDDVLAYQRALRAQRHRVADGTERERPVKELLEPIAEAKAIPAARSSR